MSNIFKWISLLLCTLTLSAKDPDKGLSKSVLELPFTLYDEVQVLRAITASHTPNLEKAMSLDSKEFGMRLKWQQRVTLKDAADHVLCLFDSPFHAFPGKNPRILILFTLNYEVAAWGSFTCEPFFEHGSILNSSTQPGTRFITINSSLRSGGALWFEEYLISPRKIEKLGEGPRYPVKPEQQSGTK